MAEPSRNVLVFGASGQIGSALAARLTSSRGSEHVHRMSWREFAAGRCDKFPESPADIVFATGLTDPSRSREELFEANLRFPQQVVAWSAQQRRDGDRFVTLGTILERFPELCRTNAYLASKLALAEWMSVQDPSRFAHVRLHTVYGGAFKPHMFLGQLASSLRRREPFRMTSGHQLREYHRVEDVSRLLDELLARGTMDGPIVELSSGKPIRLADLARAAFRAFDCEDLLEIGSLPPASAENIDRRCEPSPHWFVPPGCDPVDDVVAFLMREIPPTRKR